MGLSIGGRLKHAWNAFAGVDNPGTSVMTYGESFGNRPYSNQLRVFGDKTIIGSIYNKIAIDVTLAQLLHVRVDSDGVYQETIDSGLNNCLTVEANIDQAATAFMMDLVLTLFEEGVIAVCPIDTTADPRITGAWDIQTMRVGKIRQWWPRHVKVEAYNDNPKVGRRQEITFAKRDIAIIENPLYSVMNGPNSTLQRLITKLNLLDIVDDRVSAGKLDLIIQLPYVIKSKERRQQAEDRRKDIEMQLQGSQYGIAYTDGTERITQLNRPAENSLLTQVEYLTKMLFSQLGLTESVFDGTADEQTMTNYQVRTIDPILKAITEAMRRSFLTKTARSQGQTIQWFRDPFQFVPISKMGDISDKFLRNEVVTANEIRPKLGLKPSKAKGANELRNKNMPVDSQPQDMSQPVTDSPPPAPQTS